MTVQFEGRCACGAVSYQCAMPALAMYHCHCRACQQATGNGFSSIVVVRADAIIIAGSLRYYTMPAVSSNHAICGFCFECGSPLCAKSETNPDILVLRAASLLDPSWFKPVADIWAASAQPWTLMDPHIPKVYKSPPVFEKDDSVSL